MYKCKVCGTKFNENEYRFTEDKNKCILHCEKEKLNNYYLIGLFYVIYGCITNDWTLHSISNNINPFSIMTGLEELSFLTLFYKIVIAYLIYQLIISIRQNTRRK